MINNLPESLRNATPKTRSELAVLYGVHRNTITNWCKEIGLPNQRMLRAPELMKMYEYFGYPENA